MAEETEIVPKFDLGIESSSVYGNVDLAESFLAETDPKDIEKATEEDIQKEKAKGKEKPKEEPKKEETKKEEEIDPTKLVNSLLEEEEDEEETDTTKKVEETKKEETKTDDEPELNYFEAFSEELYKLGSFTTEDGEEPVIAKTAEEFLDLFNKEKQKGASQWLENFLAKHGEDRRELFDAIFINGVDPTKYLPVYNEVQSFESLDLEKEENQETAVRAYYTRMGFDKAEVDKKVEKLKQYADLEDEAKTIHPKLVQQDKQKLEEMQEEALEREKAKVESDQAYKGAIVKVLGEKLKTKEFDGIPLDKATADKVFDYLYTKKWKLPSGELLTDYDKSVLESKNPDNIEKRIKMALLDINNFDFSKIQKKAISKESNELFSKLAIKDSKKSNTTKQVDNSTWANIK